MAENVQWIRLKVGMFDGSSFKKIKRAKIGGIPYRDKLTSIWFELLDLAGKSNCDGYLIGSNEIPYQSYEDIAIMLDRDEKEIEVCMSFFINEKMVEIVDDVYCLTNFLQYQNQEGLTKIREQRRISQAKWRERKRLGLVGVESTVESTDHLLSYSKSNSNNNSIYNSSNSLNNVQSTNTNTNSNKSNKFIKPTLEEIKEYCIYRNNNVNAERFFNYYESNGWKVGKNPMKDWKAAVRTWENNNNNGGNVATTPTQPSSPYDDILNSTNI